eukprot:GHRR01030512.1.p1 GENE.GHRR01030512.1~~GHRR01030512.1.p1  ORF type:complete len:256 (+),score=106.28 GHRR01030512.1:255-1022(+)
MMSDTLKVALAGSWLLHLFYPRRAMKPVFECLPAFFPEQVFFVTVAYSDMSLMSLMSQGLHALPVLQVNARGRKYRYSGKHQLGLMLRFVSKALKREPLAGIEVVQLCSASSGPEQQQLQGQLHKVDGTGRDSTDSGAVDAAQQLTMCQQWQCRRWDGEVTAAELNNSQGQAALLYACVVFLGCRALWWWWQQCQRRKAAAAAPTPEPAAATTGSSESSSSSSSTLSAAEPPDTQAAAGEARPVIDRQPCSHGSS